MRWMIRLGLVIVLGLFSACSNSGNTSNDASGEMPAGDSFVDDMSDGTSPGDAPADVPELPEPTGLSAEVQLSSAGGALIVKGAGFISSLALYLPAGVLAEGQQATLRLEAFTEPESTHPTLNGAAFQVAFRLSVTPAELQVLIEKNLDIELAILPDDPKFPSERKQQLEDDPLGWAAEFLLLTSRVNRQGFEDATRCKPQVDEKLWPLDIANSRLKSDRRLHEKIYLRGPLVVLEKTFHLEILARVKRPKDATYHLWAVAKSMKPIPHTHPHLGPIEFVYFPVSVRAPAPEFDWPTVDEGRDRVISCLKNIVDRIASKLKDHEFRNLAVTVDGTRLPFRFLIYDYTTNPNVSATADYSLRVIQLPTRFVNPKLYPPTGDCIDGNNAKQIGVLAHEMFHWQQGGYLMDQNKPDLFLYGLSVWTRQRASLRFHEYTFPETYSYPAHHWLSEAASTYFEYEMMRQIAPVVRHGLTAFPLDEPAYLEIGGPVYLTTDYSYRRYHFLKFLFDREKQEPQPKELEGLGAFYEHLRTFILNRMKANEAFANVDLKVPVESWMKSQNLSWFDFFREYALLRGCTSSGKCPDVPKEKSNPYGRKPSTHSDLLNNIGESDHWSALIKSELDWHAFNDKPFSTGETTHAAESCNFDSVVKSYINIDERALEVSKLAGGRTIELPITAGLHTAGIRIDVPDDLNYQTNPSYNWRVDFGDDCSLTLRSEVWLRTEKPGSLKPVKFTEEFKRLSFSTAKPTDDSRFQTITLLVGNDSWNPASDTETKCILTLTIMP